MTASTGLAMIVVGGCMALGGWAFGAALLAAGLVCTAVALLLPPRAD